MVTESKDITGKTFGDLTVVAREGRQGTNTTWRCQCTCGNIHVVRRDLLLKGDVKSCGCKNTKKLKHGRSGTRIYYIWHGMLDRCYNEKAAAYENYGGKGIGVCDRWRESIDNLIEDMGMPPSELHTLDRRENSDGYHRDNCHWATPEEQGNNRSTNVTLEFNSKVQTLARWSRETGLSEDAIRHRLKRGWTVEKALTTPARICHGSSRA